MKDDPLNPLACDEAGCDYVARSVRNLYTHYCKVHLPGQIVRPSRIAELRRIMKEPEPKITRADIQTTGEKIPFFRRRKCR